MFHYTISGTCSIYVADNYQHIVQLQWNNIYSFQQCFEYFTLYYQINYTNYIFIKAIWIPCMENADITDNFFKSVLLLKFCPSGNHVVFKRNWWKRKLNIYKCNKELARAWTCHPLCRGHSEYFMAIIQKFYLLFNFYGPTNSKDLKFEILYILYHIIASE